MINPRKLLLLILLWYTKSVIKVTLSKLPIQQNMNSKNILHLIESRPQRLKTVHKYSRTSISLLQRTTNQIIPLAFTLEKPELLTASTNARTAKFFRIARITRIARII